MISCKAGFAESTDGNPRIHLSRSCVSREASSHPADDGRRPETRSSRKHEEPFLEYQEPGLNDRTGCLLDKVSSP